MPKKFYPCSCGSEVFVIKQWASGFSYFRVGAYGEETWNDEMYDSLSSKDCWKYYRCESCGKRAREVADDTEV